MRTSEQIIAAARGCIGARFRPQGRNPGFGLDCVGVAAIAFGRTAESDYAMWGGHPGEIVARIDASGLARVTDPGAGDLALIDAGRGQLHLCVLTGEGFVHADARLRRVVETPGWPTGIVAAWAEQG